MTRALCIAAYAILYITMSTYEWACRRGLV